MTKEEIVIGKQYNFKMFNDIATVKSINSDGTITVKTYFGTMNTYPEELEELKK